MFAKSLCIAAMTFSMAATANAAALRTFVSGFGNDSNTATNCSHAQPCRTFAMAVTVTSSGGEIEALDPSGYGPITISGPLTLVGLPGAAINAPSGGNGITINAPSNAAVSINGLIIEGGGVGYNGIVFNSGGSLTITNCVVQNFFLWAAGAGNGMLIEPTASVATFVITNTVFSNNGWAGIYYIPPSGVPNADFIIDHVVATNNDYGIYVDTTFASGGTTVTAISNGIASANSATGLFVTNGSGPLTVSIDNVSVVKNGGGIQASNTTKVLLGRSVITGNSTGVTNNTSPNTFYTYKDNRFNLNSTELAGTALNTTLAVQ